MTKRFLLRGGCVLTLGAKTPNFPKADVLIEDDRVTEVGAGLRARDAEVVDATHAIVMPGFVDTHRHAWRSLFRNLGNGSVDGAVPATPDDAYAGTLIGLLGALEAGITTVVDWSDVGPEDDTVDAALQAHTDAGLRTIFAHTSPELLPRLTRAVGPSTTIALATSHLARGDLDAAAADQARAQELGLRIHAHAGPVAPARGGAIAEAAGRGLLGPNVTLAHCSGLDDPDFDAIAASGASVSLAPSSGMADGRLGPPVQELIDRDIRPGLGVDDERVAPGDLFAKMRETISWQHAAVFELKLAGKAGLPRLMTTRDVIRYATREGAQVAGLGGVTGSLEPGMQADVIVLRTDRPNIFPVNDPIGAVVWGMDTSNIDWVFAAGRALMREGVLQADVQRAGSLAAAARQRTVGVAGQFAGAREGER